MSKVRVRFAPSPTGPLHIGGVRTALYNYLFAKKNQGDFILRIEDTDQSRFVPGAEKYITEALAWCGLSFDESPEKGGKFVPYKQSERKEIYAKYIQEILKTDYAYLAFDTPEELDKLRAEHEANGKVFSYGIGIREKLNNSLNLSEEQVEENLKNNVPYVVRFKIPEHRTIVLKDIIRGEFTIDTQILDDKVLMKNDGMPTYHFANIIDDHLMEITHVIRGEEWLPSMALHKLLYEAFGWESPEFAHLPLLLKPEGKGKLSKRDGDKHGFPVFPLEWHDQAQGTTAMGYREQGYLPEAFINMLALLGWTPSGDKEIISLEEMVQDFQLEKVHKAGARFDINKAKAINHEYILKAKAEDLLPSFEKILEENQVQTNPNFDLKIVEVLKERANFVQDIFALGKFFYIAPQEYAEKAFKKAIKEDTKAIMEKIYSGIEGVTFEVQTLHDYLHSFVEENQLGFGKVMQPLRLSLVGDLMGPDIPVILNILGKEESLLRVKKLIDTI